MSIKLVIVEPLDLVREALVRLLANDGEIDVVGETSDGPEALGQIEQLQPDVVLVDVAEMAQPSALLSQIVHHGSTDMEIVAFSVDRDPYNRVTELPAGASRFIAADAGASALVDQIKLYSGSRRRLEPALVA